MGTYQATKQELAEQARKNYQHNLKEAGLQAIYSSTVDHAINLWEQYPELVAERNRYQHSLQQILELDKRCYDSKSDWEAGMAEGWHDAVQIAQKALEPKEEQNGT